MDRLRPVLIERRRQLGLGQRELAALMGTSQSAVSELETGATINPSFDTLSRWIEALKGQVEVTINFPSVGTPARTLKFTSGSTAQ